MLNSYLTVIISSTFFLFSCSDRKNNTEKESKFKRVKLYDTLSTPSVNDNDSIRFVLQHYPYYIGEYNDSVFLNRNFDFEENYSFDFKTFNRPDSSSILIFVDTSRIIKNINPFPTPPPPPPPNSDIKNYKPIIKKQKAYNSHPVFIENTSKDTINIGYGHYISILQQAKDSLGNWQYIDYLYFYDCGTGLNETFLLENQIAITSARIFDGSFDTELRAVFQHRDTILAISNTYLGQINYGQFYRHPDRRFYRDDW